MIFQQRAIGEYLRPFGKHTVTVFSAAWDVEAYGLSKQIVAAFRFAGLDVVDMSSKTNASGVGDMQMGVRIISWLTDDLAQAIAEALESIGKLKESLPSKEAAWISVQMESNLRPSSRSYMFVLDQSRLSYCKNNSNCTTTGNRATSKRPRHHTRPIFEVAATRQCAERRV